MCQVPYKLIISGPILRLKGSNSYTKRRTGTVRGREEFLKGTRCLVDLFPKTCGVRDRFSCFGFDRCHTPRTWTLSNRVRSLLKWFV